MVGRGAQGEGSLYQRESDNKWVATLFLGYHPGTGKRIRKVFYADLQKEAVAKRRKYLEDLEGAAPKAGREQKTSTVGEWLDYWLDGKIANECEPTTRETYRIIMNRHVKPHIGAILLKDLGVDEIEAWAKKLKDDGVGLRTRQSALTRLRTALNYGLERRVQTGLKYNAAALVSMPSGPSGKKVAPPNLRDAAKLLEAARSDRLEATVTVGLSLGLRRGEVVGLKWEDVDLEAPTMTIRRHVSRIAGKLLIREGVKMDPEKHATVAMPKIAVQALRAHRGRQLEERLRAGPRWKGPEPTIDGKPAGFVFTSMVGTVLEPRNLYRSFEKMRHDAGLDEKTFHQLRHDCASLLLAQGVPMYVVSEILRHSSPIITARFYAHMTPELQRQAAAEMDKVLGPLTRQPTG